MTVQTPSIRLVCFDLGGVLIRICRSWEEGCREAGITCPPADVISGEARARRQAISEQYQLGQITCEDFAARMAEASGGAHTACEVVAIHDAWMLGEYPGVGHVVERIHDAGLRTAALSNTNHAHWERMHEFPAVMALHERLASHNLGLAKPDEAIYRALEVRTGMAGRHILFFDDLAENIATAQRLGWNAVQIDHTSRTDEQMTSALRTYGVF